MATAQIVLTTLNLNDGSYTSPADRWDGYIGAINETVIINGPFLGYCLNWDGYANNAVLESYNNVGYAGYTTNFNATYANSSLNSFENAKYGGYTTNWGSYSEPVEESAYNVDKNSVIDHPKDQIVYYKLRGWNPLTGTYESWVVSHNITGRPSLDGGIFDPIPGRQPPNVEKDVFKTPPSGNNLVNILIVARWFE